jgi:hypothetical protein
LPGGPGRAKGEIPSHDGSGPVHVGFAISADELGEWESWLSEANIAIEGRTCWEHGGESIYFRDPDGHLLELMTPVTGRSIEGVVARAAHRDRSRGSDCHNIS